MSRKRDSIIQLCDCQLERELRKGYGKYKERLFKKRQLLRCCVEELRKNMAKDRGQEYIVLCWFLISEGKYLCMFSFLIH